MHKNNWGNVSLLQNICVNCTHKEKGLIDITEINKTFKIYKL